MTERIPARVGLNAIALALSLGAGAWLPGFVLALVGLEHAFGVRRAGSDVHAAEDASERALHFGVALMSLVFVSRGYP